MIIAAIKITKMEEWIKLNNSTAGRDKVARFLQYLSRFIWYKLQKDNLKSDIQTLKNLEYQLSTFRKLLRFGRFIESLYLTLPIIDDKKASVHYILVSSKIANSLFLLADHILWLGRADICSVNTEKWSQISNKYWLFSITMNLVKDFHDISQLCLKTKISSDEVKCVNKIFNMLFHIVECVQRNDVFIDTLKNGCDFFIPLTALGYVNLSPGTVGVLGTISSILGLWVMVKPVAMK